MPQRLKSCAHLVTAISLAALVTSCGEDPELLRKYEKQKAEIIGLEGELALLNEKLKRAPKDRSDELEELKAQTEAEKAKIIALEEALASLKDERRDLEEELADFKRKYPLR